MRIVCVGEGAGDKAEGTGAETPEELEFEDVDGTMYVWDRTRRKYMPKVE
jgi:HIV Tat-specific factor 1